MSGVDIVLPTSCARVRFCEAMRPKTSYPGQSCSQMTNSNDAVEYPTQGAVRFPNSMPSPLCPLQKSLVSMPPPPPYLHRPAPPPPCPLQKSLGSMGMDTSKAVERARSASRGRKRERSTSQAGDEEMADAEGEDSKRVHSTKSRCVVGCGVCGGGGLDTWVCVCAGWPRCCQPLPLAPPSPMKWGGWPRWVSLRRPMQWVTV